MAFGSAVRGGGDQATVRLTADTGEFNAKVDAAERQWRESTGQMSREALKLELAQERLRKSLASYGAESAQAKRATIALKDAEEQAARAADRQTKETQELDHAQEQATRSVGRFSRGALAGSGVMRGMGRSIAFASSAFLGGTGLVYAIRASISAAIEQDKILANLQNALGAAGVSWEQYGSQIEDATRKTKAISGFDDEELYQSLQLLVRGTGSVTRALELNSLAADVARARDMDLVRTATLLVRVQSGQVGSLRRLGIIVKDGISGTAALEAVQRKYAGAAKAFGDSAAGAAARFRVGVGDIEKAIGRGILPQFTALTNAVAEWLNQAENQERVQRDAAEVMKDAEGVARGLASGFKVLKDVLGPVVDDLGGVEKATRDLLIALALYKLAKVAVAIRGLGVAFGFVGTSATAAAVEAVAAENAIGAGAVANAAKVGILGRALGALGLGAGGLTIVGAAAFGAYTFAKRRDAASHKAFLANVMAAARKGEITPEQMAQLQNAPSWALSDAEKRQIATLNARAQAKRNPPAGGYQEPDRGAGRLAPPTATTGGGGTGARTAQDIQTDLARARARTPTDTSDDVRYLRELEALYNRQIAALEKRKHLTQEQKQKLQSLYGQVGSIESELEGIRSSNESKVEKQRTDAAQRRQREREAAAARLRTRLGRREAILSGALETAELSEHNAMDDKAALLKLRKFYGEQIRNMKLTLDERLEYASKRRGIRKQLQDLYQRAIDEAAEDEKITKRERDRLRRLGGSDLVRRAEREAAAQRAKDGTDGKGSLTKADFRKLSFEFLSSLHGVVGQFGSNISGDGGAMSQQAVTHLWEQTQLQREQTKLLHVVAGSVRSPATRTARTELSASLWGVGF